MHEPVYVRLVNGAIGRTKKRYRGVHWYRTVP